MFKWNIYTHVCVSSVVSNSLQRHGLYVAHQAPLSMAFSRQEYWSGLPFPSQGDRPDPGIPGLLHWRQILYHLAQMVNLGMGWTYGSMDLDQFLDSFWPFLTGEGEVPKFILASIYLVRTGNVPCKEWI